MIALAAAACGDDGNGTADAPPATPDAPPAVALDCPSYCTQIMTNCKDANVQYASMDHCLGTCKGFTPGTAVTETVGDTLACRIYHSGAPAVMNATLHCPHAGPGGDQLSATNPGFCSGPAAAATNTCTVFCNLEIKTCGSLDAPLTGIAAQYQNAAACATACAAFPNKTQNLSVGAKGDSLACRLYHLTNAAAGNATTPPTTATINTHCGHTGPNGGPAAGTCMKGTAP